MTSQHLVNIGGMLYGGVLVAAAFLRSRLTDAIRIDALLLPAANDSTRMLNLVIGFALIGYEIYGLLH